MAKVLLGPLIADIRGKQGDVVFTRNLGGNSTRAWIKTPQPKTTPQLNWRAAYTTAQTAWRTQLSDQQRAAWAARARLTPRDKPLLDPYHLCGFTLFMSRNIYLAYFGTPVLLDPPADEPVLTPATVTVLTNTATPQSLIVDIASPPGWTASYICLLACTPAISAGKNNWRNCIRYTFADFPNPSDDITSAWQTTMAAIPHPTPLLVSGLRVGILSRWFNFNDGQVGPALTTSSVTI